MFEQRPPKQPYFLQHLDSACSRFAASHSLADVARAAGIGEQMLRNKLNPAQPHQLTARDLVAIYHTTFDETLFDGLLFDCGLTAVAIPPREQAPSLAHQVIATTAQVAGLGAQALTVTESGRVTKGQRNALVGAATVAMGNLAQLITEIEHKYQAIPTLSCALNVAGMAAGA